MHQNEVHSLTASADWPAPDTFYLSWLAFIRPLLLFMALAALGLIISQSARDANVILIGYGILFIGIGKALYDLAWHRSFRFYYDAEGVWVFHGILPGRRGTDGIPWQDIEQASYDRGLISWLTRAYTVRVEQSDYQDWVIAHVKHGDLAAMAINHYLSQHVDR